MSKLRQSFLETIRIMGNHSGCHQMPERSFFYKGKQFPVCARCTGVTIGEFFALFLFCCKKTIRIKSALACLGIMGIDWGIQEAGIKESTNIRRLITGFFGGLGIVSLYIIILKKIFHFFKNI